VKVGAEKDELGHATNWVRVFQETFRELKWLNAYAKLNYVASQKILKKFMKNFFVNNKNIIDQKINMYIESLGFYSRQEVVDQLHYITEWYANEFEKGNLGKAIRDLDPHQSQIRTKDAAQISYFSGMITVLLPLMLFLYGIDSSNPKEYDDHLITSTIPVFRFCFILVFLICGAAGTIQLYR